MIICNQSYTTRCKFPPTLLRFQFLSFIIFDPFIDLFITLCIVVNTLFMALDQHDMDPAMSELLQNGNYVSLVLVARRFWFYAFGSDVWALKWFHSLSGACEVLNSE